MLQPAKIITLKEAHHRQQPVVLLRFNYEPKLGYTHVSNLEIQKVINPIDENISKT